MLQITLFEDLVQDTHRLLREKESLEGQYIDVVVSIGRNLTEMRPHKPYGQFIPWVEEEFGISRQSANDYVHIAAVYGENVQRVGHLPLRVVSLLAAPSIPEEIRAQVESGEIPPTLPAIREAKRELQQEEVPATPLWAPSPIAYQTPEPVYTPPVAPTVLAREETVYAPPESVKSNTLTSLQSSESNEWYTPVQYVELARRLMGAIDVDPASNALANDVVQAFRYYDASTNGLDKFWTGRIWLNPPYGFTEGKSNQEVWTNRLIEQYQSGITTEAVLLVNANTEAKWFQPLYDYLICFTNHRIRFYSQNGDSSQPTQGNALVYFGCQRQRFIELFSVFGVVLEKVAV